MKKIPILGAGAFGFAMAKVVGENCTNKNVYLYDKNKEHLEHISKTRRHPIFHGQTQIPPCIKVTDNIENAIKNTELIVLAIPSKYLREAIKDIKPFIKEGVILVNLAKGLENKTNMTVSQLIKSELGNKKSYEICCLAGGMIAREVTLENPLCAELATNELDVAKMLAKFFRRDYLRIEPSNDLLGIELAGAFKNVIAIGAGIFDGLGYHESSKSAFISTAAREIRRLGMEMGAQKDTYGPGSQAWFGDLMTTCFGASRNREFGELIGKGVSIKEALNSQIKANKSVEGYITADVVYNLLKKHKVRAPLINDIHNVLYKNKDPREFVKHFIEAW